MFKILQIDPLKLIIPNDLEILDHKRGVPKGDQGDTCWQPHWTPNHKLLIIFSKSV